jgi:hypothetical protein
MEETMNKCNSNNTSKLFIKDYKIKKTYFYKRQKSLYYNKHFINELDKSICDTLIFMNNSFSCIRTIGILPINITTLDLSNTSIINQIPCFPQMLVKLILPQNYNCQLINLPETLEYLYLGSHFNQEVNNLNTGLKTLIINSNYNHQLDNLPINLENLEFFQFNLPLDYLPYNLKQIKLGFNFNQSIDNFPDSLETINLNSIEFNKEINKFPNNLKLLIINKKYQYYNNIIHRVNNFNIKIRY